MTRPQQNLPNSKMLHNYTGINYELRGCMISHDTLQQLQVSELCF
jgi:hypothetical protein